MATTQIDPLSVTVNKQRFTIGYTRPIEQDFLSTAEYLTDLVLNSDRKRSSKLGFLRGAKTVIHDLGTMSEADMTHELRPSAIIAALDNFVDVYNKAVGMMGPVAIIEGQVPMAIQHGALPPSESLRRLSDSLLEKLDTARSFWLEAQGKKQERSIES